MEKNKRERIEKRIKQRLESNEGLMMMLSPEEKKRIIEKAIKESEGTGKRKTIILKGD